MKLILERLRLRRLAFKLPRYLAHNVGNWRLFTIIQVAEKVVLQSGPEYPIQLIVGSRRYQEPRQLINCQGNVPPIVIVLVSAHMPWHGQILAKFPHWRPPPENGRSHEERYGRTLEGVCRIPLLQVRSVVHMGV
jgi:hypothetical protein